MRVNLSSLTSGTVIKKGFLAIVPLQDIPAPPTTQGVVTLFTISGTANGASATLQVLKPGVAGAPFVFNSTIGAGTSQELDLNSGHYTSIELPYDFTVSSVTNSGGYSFELVTSRLADIFSQIIKKIEKINKKLDYAMHLASDNISVTHTATANVSGITIKDKNVNIRGNDLCIYAFLTLNSTAQTNIGTGSITPKSILTITCSNLVLSTPSQDNETNLTKISSLTPTGTNAQIAFPSGEGTCPVVAFYAQPAISSSTFTITIYAKAVKAKGSQWYIRVHIPVVRVEPYLS